MLDNEWTHKQPPSFSHSLSFRFNKISRVESAFLFSTPLLLHAYLVQFDVSWMFWSLRSFVAIQRHNSNKCFAQALKKKLWNNTTEISLCCRQTTRMRKKKRKKIVVRRRRFDKRQSTTVSYVTFVFCHHQIMCTELWTLFGVIRSMEQTFSFCCFFQNEKFFSFILPLSDHFICYASNSFSLALYLVRTFARLVESSE